MKDIEISIVVPIYNAQKYLADCVESLLTQTVADYEIILINDGSQDKSGELCEIYAHRHRNIKFYHQKNQGVSVARNFGMQMAKGRYLVFVDADDWVEPNYLQTLLQDMQLGGMVACKLAIDCEPTSQDSAKIRLTKSEAQISVFSYNGMQGFPCAKIFDKQVVQKNCILFEKDIAVCEDLLFVTQYINATSSNIIFSNATPYHYRTNLNGVINGRFQKTMFQKKYLTEYEALKRAELFIVCDKKVNEAFRLRKAKAAVTTLRVMVAHSHVDPVLKKELLSCARQYCIKYLTSNIGAKSSKISMVLCSVSPNLEYFVWRHTIGRRKRMSEKQ